MKVTWLLNEHFAKGNENNTHAQPNVHVPFTLKASKTTVWNLGSKLKKVKCKYGEAEYDMLPVGYKASISIDGKDMRLSIVEGEEMADVVECVLAFQGGPDRTNQMRITGTSPSSVWIKGSLHARSMKMAGMNGLQAFGLLDYTVLHALSNLLRKSLEETCSSHKRVGFWGSALMRAKRARTSVTCTLSSMDDQEKSTRDKRSFEHSVRFVKRSRMRTLIKMRHNAYPESSSEATSTDIKLYAAPEAILDTRMPETHENDGASTQNQGKGRRPKKRRSITNNLLENGLSKAAAPIIYKPIEAPVFRDKRPAPLQKKRKLAVLIRRKINPHWRPGMPISQL